VVGCYRGDELPRGHHLRTVRALLRRNHQLAEIELGPLGDDDVARMLTGLLGAPPQSALAAAVAGRSDEIAVMRLVAEGNTSRQIRSTLFISPRTVEMHVQSSMHKLQCRTRAEAVRLLADLGALPQR
jgi:DNA-binding CsgD family transcriptional regulator